MSDVMVEGGALLAEGETLNFSLPTVEPSTNRAQEGFLLCRQGQILAFLNECPHWSVELDLGDGHFFDKELDRVYCKNHGALFILPDGQCETGPCMGRSLTRYVVRILGDDVLVRI